QLVDLAELDRLRRARLRARGLEPALEPVVTERALPGAAVLVNAEERHDQALVARRARPGALVEHAQRTSREREPAAGAHVALHDDGAELAAEERAGRTDLETRGVGAVLADVRRHQPPQRLRVERRGLAVEPERRLLLDEGDVAPGVRAERRGVVVALPR